MEDAVVAGSNADELALLRAELADVREQMAEQARIIASLARTASASPAATPIGPADASAQDPVLTSGPVSRRKMLLGGVGAAAAGATALVVGTASPAAANGQGQSLTLGDPSNTATVTTRITAELPGTAVLEIRNSVSTPTATAGGIYAADNYYVSGLSAYGAVIGDSAYGVGVAGISDQGAGVAGQSNSGDGVTGISADQVGVSGSGPTGVLGASDAGDGVSGTSSSGHGIKGFSYEGTAGFFSNGHVVGIPTSSAVVRAETVNDGIAFDGDTQGLVAVRGTADGGSGLAATAAVVGDNSIQNGVAGISSSAIGVYAESKTGQAMLGRILNTASTATAVHGSTVGTGAAGLFEVANTTSTAASLSGTTTGTGSGVAGLSGTKSGFSASGGVVGDSASRYGVAGLSKSQAGMRAASSTAEGIRATSSSSVGGSFSGGRAAVNLAPKSGTGKPTTGAHSRGDIVIDSVGAMFLCITSGTPGTWVKVSVTPA